MHSPCSKLQRTTGSSRSSSANRFSSAMTLRTAGEGTSSPP